MDRQHRSRTTELASTRTLEKCWLLTSGMNLRAVRPYPEKDRKRQETPKKTRKKTKKTLFSTEFYII